MRNPAEEQPKLQARLWLVANGPQKPSNGRGCKSLDKCTHIVTEEPMRAVIGIMAAFYGMLDVCYTVSALY